MTEWILIIVMSSFTSFGDIKNIRMTEKQCKSAIQELSIFKGRISATCVGPKGQKYNFRKIE